MLVSRKRRKSNAKACRKYCYGIIIPARDEEKVIGYLIDSIHKQDYPRDLIKIFVIADNCTDNTASIARNKGAVVFERSNNRYVGKGYALNYIFRRMIDTDTDCDAFIVFDADNLLDKNYIREMNRTFNKGFRIITSYRNSKNYGSNWISAGSGLWFIRESKYLNNARTRLNTSAAVSGTGFLVKRKLIETQDGWKHFLLTEDIEFTIDHIIRGEKIGYCPEAVFYDEQPITFRQSWDQRIRWARGFHQVMGKYGISLLKEIVIAGSFACFDMFMFIFPATILTMLSLVIYMAKSFYLVFFTDPASSRVQDIIPMIMNFGFLYLFLYTLGIITTITEWDHISSTPSRKILYTFTFPIFMFTYIPIAISALFRNVSWKPIQHNMNYSIEEIQGLKKTEQENLPIYD